MFGLSPSILVDPTCSLFIQDQQEDKTCSWAPLVDSSAVKSGSILLLVTQRYVPEKREEHPSSSSSGGEEEGGEEGEGRGEEGEGREEGKEGREEGGKERPTLAVKVQADKTLTR